MNEPCIWMSHIAHMNESCGWMSQVLHMNEISHTYRKTSTCILTNSPTIIMSMRHVAHTNQSCHTYGNVISHKWNQPWKFVYVIRFLLHKKSSKCHDSRMTHELTHPRIYCEFFFGIITNLPVVIQWHMDRVTYTHDSCYTCGKLPVSTRTRHMWETTCIITNSPIVMVPATTSYPDKYMHENAPVAITACCVAFSAYNEVWSEKWGN